MASSAGGPTLVAVDDPARAEVRALLDALAAVTGKPRLADHVDEVTGTVPSASEVVRWAGSGAMALTGLPDGPPAAPSAPVASRLAGAAAVLAHLSGRPALVDGPALLGERAALRDLTRHGGRSAGGASRLLRTTDRWLVVTLPRADDLDLVPAWLSGARPSWDDIAAAVANGRGEVLATTGQELGLAVAVVPQPDVPADEQRRDRPHAPALPWRITPTLGPPTTARVRVLDLSTLWAGPLCAQLLRQCGADVVTVDSVGRPDGARWGDPGLFELLHRHTTSQPLDLRTSDGRRELHTLIERADVVITSARPRALEQLDIWPDDQVARRPGLTWVAVTGYGLTGPWCNRVAYGDDAAAAGGLVAAGDPPQFCADAAADPTTGLYAAVGALACAAAGGGVVDVALRDVAAHLGAPPHLPPPTVQRDRDGWHVETDAGPHPVAPPRARST